jgi:hypothetical protein
MYDMVCWKKSGRLPFPPVKYFADRQLKLFNYDLDPGNCDEATNWKCRLAKDRWSWLSTWREWVIRGLAAEEASAVKEAETIA